MSRARFKVLLIGTLIVAIGGGGLYGLSRWNRLLIRQENRERAARIESLASLLQNETQTFFEGLHTRARDIDERYQRKMPPALSEGPVLYWVKLEFDSQLRPQTRSQARIVAVARSSQLKEENLDELSFPQSFERYVLQVLATKVDPVKLLPEKPFFVRVKKDSFRAREWLFAVFAQGVSGTPRSALAVMIEPAIAFQSILRSGNGKVAMNQRAYLLGTDGIVLAHSLESYAGASFSSWLSRLFQGKVVQGLSPEKIKSDAGVFSLQPLPFLLGVEEWLPPAKPTGVRGWFGGVAWLDAVILLCFAGILVLFLGAPFVGLIAVGRRFLGSRAREENFSSELPEPIPVSQPLNQPFRGPALTLDVLPAGAAARDSETFAQGIVPVPSAAGAVLREEAGPVFEMPPEVESEAEKMAATLQAHSLETQFLSELKMDDSSWKEKRKENLVMAQFEMNVTDATRSKNVVDVAKKTTESIFRLYQFPALFFSYCPKTRLAVLQASSGTRTDSAENSASFPLSDELLVALHGLEPSQQMRVMGDYPPLKRAMMIFGQEMQFKTWVFCRTHFTQFEPILGFLVVLGSKERLDAAFGVGGQGATAGGSLAQDKPLLRILETSNLAYEFTVHSSY